MAKANLILPDGTKVTIEGTADEVSTVVAKCSGSLATGVEDQPSQRKRSRTRTGSKTGRPKRKGPQVLIDELAQEKFFKSKRTIGEVQKKLEEKGHIYAQESLSSALLRLTRDKHVLRRLKDKKGWVYVS
jgi:hypothetical protein